MRSEEVQPASVGLVWVRAVGVVLLQYWRSQRIASILDRTCEPPLAAALYDQTVEVEAMR